tara:strand:- start:12 stop:251 length:240 start_codon:yes stop_codon:yes gene_type:complete
MIKFVEFVGVAIGSIGVVFLLVICGAFFGGVSGWIVGLFFTETILGTLSAVGISGVTMWQLGVTLGFVSGFFKSVKQSD